MSHRIHSNARTTPAIRLEMQNSKLGVVALAQKYNVTKATASKWKHRNSIEDRSHRPHRLQTTLSEIEEEIVVQLRTSLLLPLDDLVAVTKKFINPKASRSGINRCLVRHQVMCQMPKHESATTTAEVAKQTTSAQEQEHMQRNVQKLQTASLKQKVAKDQPQDSSMATKIMRLNREGLDMQSIAQQLSLPLAQVRLMLLLQTPKT